MNRREFLRLATVGGVGLVLGGAELERRLRTDPTFKVEFDSDNALSFEEASALAIRFDKAFDKLPVPEFKNTEAELYEYALEMLPQFEYEGIVGRTRFPQEVRFVYFPNGDDFNHVLGRSNCQTYAVVNGRMTFETSTWGKDDLLFTIAHELAHVQEGQELCSTVEMSLIENSAQIAAMEVVCGLANQGNPRYLWAAVNELRGMALSAAYGLALTGKRFDEFTALRSKLSPGAFSESRFQKNRRRWSGDPTRLAEILDWYNTTPLNMIIKAIRSNPDSKIEGLAFPPDYFSYSMGPSGFTPQPMVLTLDDTKYLIANLESLMVDELVSETKEK